MTDEYEELTKHYVHESEVGVMSAEDSDAYAMVFYSQAAAVIEKLRRRIDDLEVENIMLRVDTKIHQARAKVETEPVDPPVGRAELAFILWIICGFAGLDDRTVRELGNAASRLERGEDARGPGKEG